MAKEHKKEKLALRIDALTSEEIKQLSNVDNLANFIRGEACGLDLTTKGNLGTDGIANIVRQAFLLEENSLILSDNTQVFLRYMNDQDARELCSRIVDMDVKGYQVDINQLIEDIFIWTMMINKNKAKL